MNGIIPGPLWLAIASAVKGTSSENGNLIHCSENDTVTGEITERRKFDTSSLTEPRCSRGRSSKTIEVMRNRQFGD